MPKIDKMAIFNKSTQFIKFEKLYIEINFILMKICLYLYII
jgi:hypothetical protein